VVLVIPAATKNFLPEARSSHSGDAPATGQAAPKRSHARAALSAWLEPRTLATGAFVLAFAFAEGAANDWTSVAAIDGYHFSPTLGTLTLATFLASMTTGRWFSPLLLDRYGRVPVAQCLALLATAGVILFVFGPGAPFAFIGAVLWGLGTSVGFPLGMSAGGDDPDRAPARVSVIASIGYCAFLGGPPLVGFLGNHFTVRHGLIAVGALLVIALLLAPALRPPARALASPAGAQEVEQPAL
jgi:MFS family permease